RRADGVISLFYQEENLEVYNELKEMGLPLVFRSGDERTIEAFDQVQVDIAEGAEVLTRHLWENGFERVALLGGIAAEELSQQRPVNGVAQGYIKAHVDTGRIPDPELAIVCRDDGVDAADRLHCYLDRNPGRLDGI